VDYAARLVQTRAELVANLLADPDSTNILPIPGSVRMGGNRLVTNRYAQQVSLEEDAVSGGLALRSGATVPVANVGIGFLVRNAGKAPGTFADMTGQPGDSVQAGGEEHSHAGQDIDYQSLDDFTGKVKLPMDDEDEDEEDPGATPAPLDADGNLQYDDYSPHHSTTPAEMIGTSMADDELARENRARQGLPVEYADEGEMQPPSMADVIARTGGWYDNR
jgi:hypothetical protein